jgi:hypothetical protein
MFVHGADSFSARRAAHQHARLIFFGAHPEVCGRADRPAAAKVSGCRRPVPFIEGGRLIRFQSSGDGSGKLTITPDLGAEISVLVSSAGP